MALAAALSGIVMWLLAGLWHLVIVPGFYARAVGASHHEGGLMIGVGYGLLAVLMAFVYPMGHQGRNSVLQGLRFGLIMGLIWVTPHALVRAGAHAGGHSASISYLLINGGWHLIEQGIGGIIIALIYGATLSARQPHRSQA